MNIAAHIIVNITLFASWYAFLYSRKDIITFHDRLVGTLILALSQIIVTETLLGVVFERLFATELFILNIGLSALIIVAAIFKIRNAEFYQGPARYIFREAIDVIINTLREIFSDLFLLTAFILVVLTLCWMILIAYLFPSYTWDALWYHLPIVGYIMQSGAIKEIPNVSFINQFIDIFPKNIELFFVWNIIFLKSDVLVDLSQLLFTIMSMLAIYSLSLKLGINRRIAMFASMMFFFTPIVILQSTTNYVDVAISALFLVSINFILGGSINGCPDNRAGVRRRYCILLAGLSSGILLGAKGSGPLFIVLISCLIFIVKVRRYLQTGAEHRGTMLVSSVRLYIVCFVIPAFVLGGYWYMRNWFIYGNPVYPMEISIFGKTIFKGLYRGIVEPPPDIINHLTYLTRPLYVWTENIKYYIYDSRLGGLGTLWFVVMLPGIFLSALYALIKRHYRFLAVTAIFILAFLVYPRNWTPRYVIFIVGCGALSFGYFLYQTGDRKILKIISLLLIIYSFVTSNSPCVTPQQVKKFLNMPPNQRTIAAHAPFNIDIHARQEYGYWTWINNNIKRGDVLAYTFDPLFLAPLWNRSFSNRIVSIKGESYSEFVARLTESEADYVLIKTNSIEDNWIKSVRSIPWMGLKERFDIVYSDKNYTIARFGITGNG